MEEQDLVIIGSGVYGITCATTYHRLHPEATILILDSSPSIGGPWARHRIFPGLNTNNLWGMYEHPDFPMDQEKFGVKRGEHVPAEKMLEYLEAFAEWGGVTKYLRLNTAVEVIEKDSEYWALSCTSSSSTSGHSFHIRTKKLIIAVGTTAKPHVPKYPTSPSFEPPVIHSKEFPAHFKEIVKPNAHTLVIGSSKSAWDVSYACATQPSSTATILIRPSGNGPMYMTPSHVTPFTLWLEKLVFTRFFDFMSPCPWASTSGIEGWLRSFLHGTWLGRKIAGAFWNILTEDAVSLNKLNDHPETKKLRPWRGAFEVGNGLSIHNYPTNFFDLVRDRRIKIVVDEIASFGAGNEVHLKSGEKLHADAVVCATGWEVGNSFSFKPPDLEASLGLPTTRPLTSAEELSIRKAEEDLHTRFPYLHSRDTSRTHHPDPSVRYTQDKEAERKQQPYRLHRFIVPPAFLQHRSIAFAGAVMCLGTFPCAYIQSLWIASFFDGSLSLPSPASQEQIQAEMLRDTQYGVIRGAMGFGRTLPDLVWDSLPYFDVLLGDLGFEGKRKGGVLGLRECVASYGPEDYRGLVDEAVKRRGRGGEGKKDV